MTIHRDRILESLPDGFSAVIKSTVVPGTTQRFHDDYPHLKVAYSPEFLVERRFMEDFANQDLLICGTHHPNWLKIFDQHRKAGVLARDQTFHVDPTVAELVKYSKNYFYALKVFSNQCMTFARGWGLSGNK